MSEEIKKVLSEHIPINVTPALANAIIKYVSAYESVPNNAEAFNSPYLGVTPCYFTTADRNGFLEIFAVDAPAIKTLFEKYNDGKDKVFGVSIKRDIMGLFRNFFNGMLRAASSIGVSPADMRKIISEISSVDSNFKVASDPFNLLNTYILWRLKDSNLPEKLKYQAMFKTLMILQYKFFTSLVNHRFPYKADENTMQAMYESFTNKFDIKKYGTWYKVMANRAENFIGPDSVHLPTLKYYNDDKKIIYLITDVQTRIRNQVNLVTSEYMNFKKNMDSMGSYSNMGNDLEGDRVMLSVDNNLEMCIANVYNDCLSVPRLLDDQAMLLATKLFAGVTLNKFRMLLIAFSEKAVKDAKAGTFEKMKHVNGIDICEGAQILIRTLLQKTFRHCIQNKVSLNKPVDVLKTAKDVYSSSRISDQGIIQVRESVNYMVETIFKQHVRNPTMLASYRLCFIIYIVLMSFKYIK